MTPVSPTVDDVLRQVRRVRWRYNLQEVQRTLYLLCAVGAGAAPVFFVLALAAPLPLFVAGGGLATLGAAAAIGLVARSGWRRWLGPRAAPLWIDTQAGLGGRLATLVELDARGDTVRRPFLLPLLEAMN